MSSAIKINGSWFGKGVAFDIFSLLQEMYQFNYSIILPRENTLGSKRSGIFELIYNKVRYLNRNISNIYVPAQTNLSNIRKQREMLLCQN